MTTLNFLAFKLDTDLAYSIVGTKEALMVTLLSTDRCDSCFAQAYVRFTKQDLVLDFCGHHAAKYDSALDSNGWTISLDTRELLTRRPVGAESR